MGLEVTLLCEARRVLLREELVEHLKLGLTRVDRGQLRAVVEHEDGTGDPLEEVADHCLVLLDELLVVAVHVQDVGDLLGGLLVL